MSGQRAGGPEPDGAGPAPEAGGGECAGGGERASLGERAGGEGPAAGARRAASRRVRGVLAVGGVVLAVAAGALAAVGFGGTPESTASRGSLPPATAKVTRQTLTETQTVDGTLGYGDQITVSARGTNGVLLTWVPDEGATVGQGKALYKVDNEPVLLLYGAVPVYETLAPGVSGLDVRVLEKALAALGYDGFTVDDEYTSATADAVRDWQDDNGLPVTGVVQPAQVVVAPGKIRVAKTMMHPGDLATGPVLAYTGTTRVVTVALDVAEQDLVHKGVAATVELPDGSQVAGTVDRVGTVATTQSTGAGANQQSSTTIDVTVTVADQGVLGTLDSAPVQVTLQSDRAENVLTVPVNALVALAEGGYGVQVVQGQGTRYVAVTTGLFADGRVEVSGPGLAEGMLVGVPK